MDWLGALAASALLGLAGGLGGLIVWVVKSRLEELRSAQERLASDRRRVYAELLDPYVRIFAAKGDDRVASAVNAQILSAEYRKTALEVMLVGTDDVVDAYNDLMQHFYRGQVESPSGQSEALRLFGVLLLAVRKSVGNSTTQLDEWDMLTHMITDLDDMLRREGIVRTKVTRRRGRRGSGSPPPSRPTP